MARLGPTSALFIERHLVPELKAWRGEMSLAGVFWVYGIFVSAELAMLHVIAPLSRPTLGSASCYPCFCAIYALDPCRHLALRRKCRTLLGHHGQVAERGLGSEHRIHLAVSAVRSAVALCARIGRSQGRPLPHVGGT